MCGVVVLPAWGLFEGSSSSFHLAGGKGHLAEVKGRLRGVVI